MKLLPIRAALKLGDYVIFAISMFEREEEDVEIADKQSDFGFAPERGELEDRQIEVQ